MSKCSVLQTEDLVFCKEVEAKTKTSKFILAGPNPIHKWCMDMIYDQIRFKRKIIFDERQLFLDQACHDQKLNDFLNLKFFLFIFDNRLLTSIVSPTPN